MFKIKGYNRNAQFTAIHDVVDYVLNFYRYELDGGALFQNEVFEEMESMKDELPNYTEDDASEYVENTIVDGLTFDLDHLYNSKLEQYGFTIEHEAA